MGAAVGQGGGGGRGQTEQGVAQMRKALQMGGSADAVVLALEKQLSDHIQAVGGPVGLL